MDRKELIANLKMFKKEIRKKYNITKLILFGSYATGKIKEHSDVDLIIVGEFKEKGNINRAPLLYHEWHLVQKIDLPVDFLCYTPEEFKKLSKQITIVGEALKEGIVI
ncbi:MAG: nucleotidyltransferase domain-containing protein [Candidatus Thermoplasmatota archaeon]